MRPPAPLSAVPGSLRKPGVVHFQFRLDTQDVVVGEQPALAHRGVARAQRLAIARDFLGGGRRGRLGIGDFPKQLVVRGDDVLYGRAVFGFLQAQGVDEDALVGHGGGHALEFRELAAGGREFPENIRPLKALGAKLRQGPDFSHFLVWEGDRV